MQVAIHKMKMVKRFTFPELKGMSWFGNKLLIGDLLRMIEIGEGYELVVEGDFVGDLLEKREVDTRFDQGDYIYVDGELKEVEYIVHTPDEIICVVGICQVEEDDITEKQKAAWIERLNRALTFVENQRELDENYKDSVGFYRIEEKKSWFRKMLG